MQWPTSPFSSTISYVPAKNYNIIEEKHVVFIECYQIHRTLSSVLTKKKKKQRLEKLKPWQQKNKPK
jgi:hypothetical protein